MRARNGREQQSGAQYFWAGRQGGRKNGQKGERQTEGRARGEEHARSAKTRHPRARGPRKTRQAKREPLPWEKIERRGRTPERRRRVDGKKAASARATGPDKGTASGAIPPGQASRRPAPKFGRRMTHTSRQGRGGETGRKARTDENAAAEGACVQGRPYPKRSATARAGPRNMRPAGGKIARRESTTRCRGSRARATTNSRTPHREKRA